MTIPTDPYLGVQWHLINENSDLLDLNIDSVWSNNNSIDKTSSVYSGKGTRVAVVADGFDYNHSDLVPNYDRALDYDFEFGTGDAYGTAGNFEGTAMAGLIGAAANGTGTVGVAYGATLIGYRMRAASWSSPWDWLQDVSGALDRALSSAQADVTVLSEYIGEDSQHIFGFGADPDLVAGIRQSITNAVTLGRSGLGMSLVKAAGEQYFDWEDMDPTVDINMDPWTKDTRQIVVSGISEEGEAYKGTNTGAPVLVSAFGAMDQYFNTNLGGEIFTTDRIGSAGFGNRSYIANYSGTNAAASMVAGVVSLMYEANAALGWRDVQSILAASARHVGPEMTSLWGGWGWNGAETWNGGGLHFSNLYGYGLVDAWAAVRLAETWRLTGEGAGTSATESSFALDVLNSTTTLPAEEEPSEASFSRNSATNLVVERVTVTIVADIEDLRVLSLYLVSPSGTESELMSHDGADQWNGNWTFETQAFRGERSIGAWTVRIVSDGATLSISDAVIRVSGHSTLNDRYVFTDEYSDYGPSVEHESYISDDNGGTDTVNASAVSSGSIIRLDGGASRIDGIEVSFYDTIENAIGGDLGDNITGGIGANQLYGRRGADSINGGAGIDGVYGAWGNDTLNGGSGVDTVTGGSGNDTVIDDDLLNGDQLLGEAGVDTIDYSRVSFGAGLVTLNLTTGLATTTASSARDTISGFENALGSQGGETIRGTSVANILTGNGGDDRLIGEAGNDVLTGGLGKDTLFGGAGADRFVFTSRAETPLGAATCDALVGYTNGPAFDGAGATAGDIIDLAGIDANEATTGNQAFTFSTAQTIGTLRCFESNGLTWVLGYTNSIAGADFQIEIQDGTVLASTYRAADFVL